MPEILPPVEGPVCPLPLRHDQTIMIGHGSGGRMTQELIEQVFLQRFPYAPLQAGNDFARVQFSHPPGAAGSVAISTDMHIVSPLFFNGGDIGRLAVCGTVNDISMSGGIPLFLTAGFILEEGLPVSTLEKVVSSMAQAAEEAGVQIVAGDTKVAEKGKADGIFINTAGFGWIPDGRQIGGAMALPGDVVLLSGTVGEHGMAVLSARGELGLLMDIASDVAPLNALIQAVLEAAPHTRVLRDPTRGGLATTLNEIASQSKVNILIEETAVPVQPAVRTACELLGFDPLYVANEGKVIVITPAEEAEAALSAMRNNPYGRNAARIGVVNREPQGRVLLRTAIGGTRLLDTLAGEMLPRIC